MILAAVASTTLRLTMEGVTCYDPTDRRLVLNKSGESLKK